MSISQSLAPQQEIGRRATLSAGVDVENSLNAASTEFEQLVAKSHRSFGDGPAPVYVPPWMPGARRSSVVVNPTAAAAAAAKLAADRDPSSKLRQDEAKAAHEAHNAQIATGFSTGVVAGILCALTLVPFMRYCAAHPSARPLDFLFGQAMGTWICSTAVYALATGHAVHLTEAGSLAGRSVIWPAVISGMMNTAGMVGTMVMLPILGNALGMELTHPTFLGS